MIRYPITKKALEALIDQKKKGWLIEAKKRTAVFIANGKYDEKSSIWSAVKPIYMRLQGESKCAYCEQQLESVDLGKAVQDVEHFRPKGSVKAWKAPKALTDAGIPFAIPPATGGYYALPYHPFNYAASCKPCNSALKKDHFPVAAVHDLAGTNPRALRSEKAYLIYPIGSIDEDPEKLIEFYGVSPRPVSKRGHRKARAWVTIEFFRLDDPLKRKNLFLERARMIMTVESFLRRLTGNPTAADKAAAEKVIKAYTRPSSPHTNCVRSFVRLYKRDRPAAEAIAESALDLIASSS